MVFVCKLLPWDYFFPKPFYVNCQAALILILFLQALVMGIGIILFLGKSEALKG